VHFIWFEGEKMEIGNLSIHIHQWCYDSNGAIYCLNCRKFKGWKPGKITKVHMAGVGEVSEGWGYLINGEDWVKEKEKQISYNCGLYI
jgi:hypothetical protein